MEATTGSTTSPKLPAHFTSPEAARAFAANQGPKFLMQVGNTDQLEQCLLEVDGDKALLLLAQLREQFYGGQWLKAADKGATNHLRPKRGASSARNRRPRKQAQGSR